MKPRKKVKVIQRPVEKNFEEDEEGTPIRRDKRGHLKGFGPPTMLYDHPRELLDRQLDPEPDEPLDKSSSEEDIQQLYDEIRKRSDPMYVDPKPVPTYDYQDFEEEDEENTLEDDEPIEMQELKESYEDYALLKESRRKNEIILEKKINKLQQLIENTRPELGDEKKDELQEIWDKLLGLETEERKGILMSGCPSESEYESEIDTDLEKALRSKKDKPQTEKKPFDHLEHLSKQNLPEFLSKDK